MSATWIKLLFVVAALYDGLLGLAFVLFQDAIFQAFAAPPPSHPGYVTFPALLLLIFAALFFRIARDPLANRGLILYGVALKVAYSGTAFWYQLNGGISSMWIPWAWADLGFIVLFLVAWKSVGRGTVSP